MKSLKESGHLLADDTSQIESLHDQVFGNLHLTLFEQKLESADLLPI